MTEQMRWETVDSRTAYACPGFDVVNDEVRLPDGTETEFDYVHESPAAVVLPLTDDDEVVVIEEYRHAVDRVSRGLPAGSIEGGEKPARAARRELAEETGYTAGSVDRLATVEPTNGIADSVHHHFLARGCTPDGEMDLDFNENIRVLTIPYGEFHESVLDGDLRDGRSALTVLYYEATD